MRFDLISFDETELSGAHFRPTFDRKLEICLAEGRSRAVVIHLRADMSPSLELLEWLETWTRRFKTADMRCLIVPQTPAQLECLELSHPDQNLIYAGSIDEIEPLLPPPEILAPVHQARGPFEEAEFEMAPPLSSDKPGITVPDPSYRAETADTTELFDNRMSLAPFAAEKVPAAPVPVMRESVPEPAARADAASAEVDKGPVQFFSLGTVSTTSGEYICQGCQAPRMWLKGETMTPCANPECLQPDAGWLLSWDLF